MNMCERCFECRWLHDDCEGLSEDEAEDNDMACFGEWPREPENFGDDRVQYSEIGEAQDA